jgi:hypothetical protein
LALEGPAVSVAAVKTRAAREKEKEKDCFIRSRWLRRIRANVSSA